MSVATSIRAGISVAGVWNGSASEPGVTGVVPTAAPPVVGPVGVVGAVWASRIRYFNDAVRKGVSGSLGVEILGIRIRVVPPSA